MATNDLLTIAEARTAVNVPSAAMDTELQLYLTGISDRIDALCGPVVARTVTAERHDGGTGHVLPRVVPVYSVTTVTEYEDGVAQVLTAETITSRPADAYMLDTTLKFRPLIRRRESGTDTTYPADRLNVSLTYSAGRVADTASVDERFKVTAAAILRRLWKREQSMWARTASYGDEGGEGRSEGFFKAVDPMIREFLADEVLPPSVG